MKDILDNLNQSQLKAVTHDKGAMLILAGAGTGKTKTITTRLAYLIKNLNVNPLNTLTLTFTNKAANEMRNRALSIINTKFNPLLCTFHKFGLLFLQKHINKLGRDKNFSIIDTDDKKKILKNLNNGIDDLANKISTYKNELIKPEQAIKLAQLDKENNEKSIKIASIYQQYEEYLFANNLLDFDDLLSLSYEILNNNDSLASEISNRYQYIMVDEYQDTNELQYRLLKKLCKEHENIAVVGDDDQSIYGWRGAKIENILNFQNQFKNVKIVKLEKNYRSTSEILNAANELIEHNRNRLGKNLNSNFGSGQKIIFNEYENETEEAKGISNEILKLIKNGENANDIAVLYRINALSRAIEEQLARNNINYKILGAIKFYERAEIKDIVSYLRLIYNEHDDFSITRIINKPKRGLGKAGMEKLQNKADENKISIFDAIDITDLSTKTKQNLLDFKDQILYLQNNKNKDNFIEEFEKTIGLKKYYAKLEDSDEKVKNIDEFYGSLKQKTNENLNDFLNELSLFEGENQNLNGVNLMSIHASKGLEFKNVFIIGLEEGFFPLIGDDNDIDEERRLAYVAITRAKKFLNLSCARHRFLRGSKSSVEKSRFVIECGLCKGPLKIQKSNEFKKGDKVLHAINGQGKVIEINKNHKDLMLIVKFNNGGIKQIMSKFLKKII